uniref:Carrier domain-containing protein n=1 Tax=Chromera velia CCMP2878 TaxID=1169474 RepID=A0A0G4G1D0_9ALVE|eukprot:Cvel_19605.t1-p1 / transcript=Cvel_19605.t1 / gene=Cvel_19605 / organism=Chromera_velia_CCMP2878 / gene_product=hypothetical protein / transcript_product=hypothetical protein / location=Cvel_scaffold1704:20975-23800(-) / protein_length=93 / sequence_SO=supercontig / SO=protein_coding / is_pseudo=false
MEDIVYTVKTAIHDEINVPYEEIDEDYHLNFQLEMDSMAQLEVLARVQEELGIEIPEVDLPPEKDYFWFVGTSVYHLQLLARQQQRYEEDDAD